MTEVPAHLGAPFAEPRVCAIVVTYQPELPVLTPLLEQLDAAGCDFIVIDNGSSNSGEIQAVLNGKLHALGFIENGRNIGQAAALNVALDKVKIHGHELALLFDQDSSIGPDFVSRMLRAWGEAQRVKPDHVAAIGPRLVEPRSGRRMPFRTFHRLLEKKETRVRADADLIETAFLITSGSLISMVALGRIGAMRSDYFIDNVDLEWCFRARASGFELYGTDHATLQHRIGEDSSNPLVRHGIVVQHSALRYYYSTRNRLHLHQQPYTPTVWRIKDTTRFVLKSLYLLAVSRERKAFWLSLRRALRDVKQLT
ncbi:glycosyltransferase family 2 protein [Hydrogenophaga sp.]|uniref:glycosyltransferase family 2 protein n=1 Tax=Hydrogenophaga sp. TaxID=1904254 RepID=UPI002723C983|nr:glycosyltransferase family 2 protein [Hydrogenophaga sp.]MDO8903918.1 glycosyltransferase family 2 protein [Hydrogenophaga sp.]